MADSVHTHILLPLPKALFLVLDLFCEASTQCFFFFFEFRVVQLFDLWLTELQKRMSKSGSYLTLHAYLAGLHLRLTVILIVNFLSRVDEVEHMCTNKE